MSDPNVGFDLDNEVEEADPADDEFETVEVEAEESGEDVESPEGDESPKQSRARRKELEENVDPSEFMHDGTPRPRQPASGEKKAKGPKKNYVPVPEGWLTPVGLRNHLFDERIVNVTPQSVYGMVKNGKNFPYKLHTDGRYIVPVTDETAKGETYEDEDGKPASNLVHGPSEVGAVTWVIKNFERRAEREAKKAAEANKSADNTGVEHSDDQPDTEAPVEGVIG